MSDVWSWLLGKDESLSKEISTSRKKLSSARMNFSGQTMPGIKSVEKNRDTFVIGIIGINRTGKSVEARKRAIDWKESRPSGLIISHDPQKRFQDISDYLITPAHLDWPKKILDICKSDSYKIHNKSCLVILDDVRMINEQHTPVKGFAELMYMRAELNIDIIWIVHNPSLMLNILAFFTDKYFIFYTLAQEGTFEKKIPSSALCIAASNFINSYVQKHGKGEYPTFPYIVVDVQNGVLEGYNIGAEDINNAIR